MAFQSGRDVKNNRESPVIGRGPKRKIGGNVFIVAEIGIFLLLIVGFSSFITFRSTLEKQMSAAASIVGESLPYFFENGQNLINGIADELEVTGETNPSEVIRRKILEVPYFTEVILVDQTGQFISGYPEYDSPDSLLTPSEQKGIELVAQGVHSQVITSSPPGDGGPVQVTFVAAVQPGDGDFKGTLFGRTDLATNPFLSSALAAIQPVDQNGMDGYILDGEKRIVYPPNSRLLMQTIPTELPSIQGFFRSINPDGINAYMYYYPVKGKPWSILLSRPISIVIQSVMINTLPILGSILLFLAILIMVFRNQNGNLTTRTVADTSWSTPDAEDNSRKNAAKQQHSGSGDKLGKYSLDTGTITARFTNILKISRAISGSVETKKVIGLILDSALDANGSMAKIVVYKDFATYPASEEIFTYSAGENRKDFGYLDKPLFTRMQELDRLIIPEDQLTQFVDVPEGKNRPGGICAYSIRQEKNYYGVLYLVCKNPGIVEDTETNYLQGLAALTALVIQKGLPDAGGEPNSQMMISMLDSSADPVMLIDSRLRLIFANQAAIQLQSLLKENARGKFINEVVLNQKLLDLFGRPLEENILVDEISLKTGGVYHVSLALVPFNNGTTGKVAVLRDESRYKEMDSLKTEYINLASHNLRSPLSLLKGYASMLSMVGELNDQQKMYSQKIVSITDQMAALVSDLLDLGRIEGGIGLNLEKFQIQDILKNIINLLQPQMNQKKIIFGTDLPELSETAIEADPTLIQQALYNLLENAIKYTQVNGKILVRVRINEPNIIFEIVDTGIGIAPLDLPHIFDKFYKVSGKNGQQYGGTSLGLSIVKSIALRHKGRVWAVSKLGKGSVFYLEIPIKQEKNSKN